MKNPKDQFLESKDIARRHLERMDEPEMQHCLMVALAQYTYGFGKIDPVNDAKRVGAQEFIGVLCNLSIPRPEPKGTPPGTLIDPDFRSTAERPFPN